tara:strand:- start:5 stop:748 length:744 start_codon:yes stop_codon:yes gene_type:complete
MIQIKKISKELKGNDLEFFQRVWSSDLQLYSNRIKAIDFIDKSKVLDAGFGMGQWLVPLSKMNKEVHGIEFSSTRVKVVKKLIEALDIRNTTVCQGSIEDLPYENNFFDAIFCYGVLFCTNFKKSLKEFYRVLKPGGALYFTANELGWFLYLLYEEHNKSKAYSPKKIAIEAIQNSLEYYDNSDFKPGTQVIIPVEVARKNLENLGFTVIKHDSEGYINLRNKTSQSFYKHKEYMSYGFIYEVLARK